jgi:TRAP-type C4-dicarboxylate transport system permease small subunit
MSLSLPDPAAADADVDAEALPDSGGVGVHERWEYLLVVPAAIALLGLVGLTFVDVIGRYFIGAPVRGATELVELAMVVIVFLGLPLVTRHDEHLSLDFLDRFVSARASCTVRAAMGLLIGGCLFWLAWLMLLKGLDIGRSGDATMVLSIALGPFILFIAFAAAIDGLVNIVLAVRGLRALRRTPAGEALRGDGAAERTANLLRKGD